MVGRFRDRSDQTRSLFSSRITRDGSLEVYDNVGSTLRYHDGTYYESLRDTVGNRNTVNLVDHLQVDSTVKVAPPNLSVKANGSSTINFTFLVEPFNFELSQVGNGPTQHGLLYDFSPSVKQQYAYDAYTAFSSQIPSKMLLANSIYELRDIKGLLPKIEKSLLRTTSSNFLGFQFGIKPMIGDIKTILNLGDAIAKRIQFLRSNANKVIPLSFVRTITPRSPGLEIRVPFVGTLTGLTYVFKEFSYQGVFRIFGKLVQNLDIPDTKLTTIKAFAAAAGFNNPAAIVWEAIPYSFVIDWFFHVSSLIDTLNIQPFGGEFNVSKVGWSLKDSIIWGVYLEQGPEGGFHRDFLGQVTIRRFHREPGFPVGSLFLTDGSLSPTQQLLAGALLEQRR